MWRTSSLRGDRGSAKHIFLASCVLMLWPKVISSSSYNCRLHGNYGRVLVVQYLSAFSRANGKGQTQLATWSAAFFKAVGLHQVNRGCAAGSISPVVEMSSLRPRLRQYLGNSPEGRAALDVAIALMLQASEDFHAQDVGMSFLQGLDY